MELVSLALCEIKYEGVWVVDENIREACVLLQVIGGSVTMHSEHCKNQIMRGDIDLTDGSMKDILRRVWMQQMRRIAVRGRHFQV